MKRLHLLLCATALAVAATAAARETAPDQTSADKTEWAPAGSRILTGWGESLDPSDVLPEYPRPIMERESWLNLNGLWSYKVIDRGGAMPQAGTADGNILVPFAIESSLSGVGERLGADKELVYTRTFTVPAAWKGSRVMLNFGAVDWKTDVWVNGVKVGSHTGGFTPLTHTSVFQSTAPKFSMTLLPFHAAGTVNVLV